MFGYGYHIPPRLSSGTHYQEWYIEGSWRVEVTVGRGICQTAESRQSSEYLIFDGTERYGDTAENRLCTVGSSGYREPEDEILPTAFGQVAPYMYDNTPTTHSFEPTIIPF